MTMLALDWNATRVRGVLGAAGDYPLPVPLEPPALDLPMAISLAKSAPEVGSAGLRQSRSAGHLVCQTYLPHLNAPPSSGPRWQAGRHSLDARDACELVWRKLHPLSASAHGIVLNVPSYLAAAQAETLRRLAGRLPVLGSLPTVLAAALAGHVEQFWTRSVLVIDVDDHALTLGWVKALADKAHLIDSRSFTQLSLRHWKERLLDALAELCVHQHRRDPRDAPHAEQSLYDQLEPLTDAAMNHQAIQLGVQGQQWFKHLLVHPEQPAQYCAALARQAAHEAEHLLVCWPASELPRCILLTHQAGRLPGLVEALRALVMPSASAETKLPSSETNYHDEDFGEDLLLAEPDEPIGIFVLPAEGPARAAHGLADLFRRGALPVGHLETIVPLPATPAADAGPPRLHVSGLDFLLHGSPCTLGSQFGCQVHFERNEHPEVAARHCEITLDANGYTLHNRCREGTLVNDHVVVGALVLQPGDRIRLGPRGPLVRIFGRLRQSVHVEASER